MSAAPRSSEALPAPSVLGASVPVLVATFVNRCGTIGLSLVPMLLVQRREDTASAATVMLVASAAHVAGTFLGGLASGRIGPHRAVIVSLGLSAAGLGLLPAAPALPLLAGCAAIAQLGTAMYPSAVRLLLAARVGPAGQQEAFGWLRGAGNLGSVVSYGFGAALGSIGIFALMWLDSATSLAAAVLTGIWLRRAPAGGREQAPAEQPRSEAPEAASSLAPLFAYAAVTAGYMFVYELFLVSASASAQRAFGAAGLRFFSAAMVLNALLCALSSVKAARYFRRVDVSFPMGLLLTGTGAAIAAFGAQSPVGLLLGTAVLTFGEVVFAATSQHVLLRAAPAGPRRGAYYGAALLLQSVGRILGGTLAFPLVVDAPRGPWFVLACAVALVAAWFAVRVRWLAAEVT